MLITHAIPCVELDRLGQRILRRKLRPWPTMQYHTTLCNCHFISLFSISSTLLADSINIHSKVPDLQYFLPMKIDTLGIHINEI